MNIKFYIILFYIFITYLQINSLICNNEFVLGEYGESWLKVNNSFCECKNYIGDGSYIKVKDNSLLGLNDIVTLLQIQITTLQNNINELQNKTTELQNKNNDLQNQLNSHNNSIKVMCTVSTNISQSIFGGPTKIFFNIVEIDTNDGWDLINNIYTIPITGYYLITAQMVLDISTNVGSVYLGIVKNEGTTYSVYNPKPNTNSWLHPISFPGRTLLLNKNDTISLAMSTDISMTTYTNSGFNWFNIVLL